VWDVEVTDEFVGWWNTLSVEEQERITVRIEKLQQRGPALGRPLVETIASSQHANMKELRVGSLRIFFVFDMRRVALLLVGGDKAGRWTDFYAEFVSQADELYNQHIAEMRKEAS
jgi:hypothetical protein